MTKKNNVSRDTYPPTHIPPKCSQECADTCNCRECDEYWRYRAELSKRNRDAVAARQKEENDSK